MKVVFIQDVPNVGGVGDVKEVKKGHARNYLFPKGFAVPATEEELRRIESRRRAAAREREERMATTYGIAGSIDGITLTFAKRVTSKGNIYGSVSSTAIQHELKSMGHDVEKSMIKLEEPLRQLGEHEVEIEFSKEAVARVKIVIEPAGEEKGEDEAKEKPEPATVEVAAEEQSADEPEEVAEEMTAEEEPVEEPEEVAEEAAA
ncbi:MAG: 50S ribosomal protein L9, partial [Dehalococcoidia bacterium]